MRKPLIKHLIKKLFQLLPYLLLVVIAIPIVGMSLTEGTKLLGLRTVPVPVIGTGSMYPSLFWDTSEGGPEDDTKSVIEEYRTTPHLYLHFKGIHIMGKKFLHREIGRGDMVAFQNDKTKEILSAENKDQTAGFIKRIIAIPGDIIELRDGFVYLNGQLLSEPYISQARSTYGGDFIKDCVKLTIPPDKYFVLGDNRKVSSDSRFELGLVSNQDINYILPLSEQNIYHSLWRDTDKDDELLGQPTLSATEFVGLVNDLRKSKNTSGLKLVPSLVKSSTIRGEKILGDEHTNYDMKKAISSSGYSNIVLGEFVSHGHYSAKELFASLLYNPSTAKQILNHDFSDIGVSAVNLNIDGCPSQVIVGHLGGYIPASYNEATLSSWKRLVDNLNTVIPSWEEATGYNDIDQSKLGSLLTILYRRQTLAKEIVGLMEARAWLSDDQQARIKADEGDARSAELLINELNKR